MSARGKGEGRGRYRPTVIKEFTTCNLLVSWLISWLISWSPTTPTRGNSSQLLQFPHKRIWMSLIHLNWIFVGFFLLPQVSAFTRGINFAEWSSIKEPSADLVLHSGGLVDSAWGPARPQLSIMHLTVRNRSPTWVEFGKCNHIDDLRQLIVQKSFKNLKKSFKIAQNCSKLLKIVLNWSKSFKKLKNR